MNTEVITEGTLSKWESIPHQTTKGGRDAQP